MTDNYSAICTYMYVCTVSC